MKLNTVVDFNADDWPYIHDSMIPNAVSPFYGTDSKELFERNKKYQKDDWIYHHKDIVYNFNSSGLRMTQNVENVESEFIYFSGTSFTMGIGINEEDRYTELLSNTVGLDFINFSGPTYSIKLQTLSFFNFLKTHRKPKILVMEYAPSIGYTFLENNKAITYYSKHIPNTIYNNTYEEFKNTDFLVNEAHVYKKMLQTLCKECNIKLVELSFHPNDKFIDQDVITIDLDSFDNLDINLRFGRDIIKKDDQFSGHPGIGVHKYVVEKIEKIL